MRTRVKICCMASPGEVRAAAIAGADAVGAVGPMPSGPGPIDDAAARVVIGAAPPGVTPFLLTSELTAEAVVRHLRATHAPVVQLVRHLDPRVHAEIRNAMPWVKIVQVVHVEDDSAIELARGYAMISDALLLDSGNPSAGGEVEALGGTGRRHDWEISRRIVQAVDKPVWLAGGLTEANAIEAINQVRPFGLDLCSGARTLGKLDQRKLTAFMTAVRTADRTV